VLIFPELLQVKHVRHVQPNADLKGWQMLVEPLRSLPVSPPAVTAMSHYDPNRSLNKAQKVLKRNAGEELNSGVDRQTLGSA
jgi:hypothetical protein